jgi:hypothetical protein
MGSKKVAEWLPVGDIKRFDDGYRITFKRGQDEAIIDVFIEPIERDDTRSSFYLSTVTSTSLNGWEATNPKLDTSVIWDNRVEAMEAAKVEATLHHAHTRKFTEE